MKLKLKSINFLKKGSHCKQICRLHILLLSSVKFLRVGITQSVWRLGYGMDGWGSVPGRGNEGNLCLRHCIQIDSGAHPASYLVSTGDSYPGIKVPGCETGNLPPSTADVKNAWICTSVPHQTSWHVA